MSMCIKAQDLIVPKSGDPIKAFNLELSDKFIFYTLTPKDEGKILKIEKEKVLLIRRSDDSKTNEFNSRGESRPVASKYPEIAEEDIHGCLIEKGNRVFIPTNSAIEYEKAGQKHLKELVSELGYWIVVDRPEQAHFILQFITEIRGKDTSFLIIRPRKYYREYPSPDSFYSTARGYFGTGGGYKLSKDSRTGIVVNYISSNENPETNLHNADKMFYQLKQILLDRESKESQKFFKIHNNALNADTDNNNSSHGDKMWLLQ